MKTPNLSPVEQAYAKVKNRLPAGTLLLFRLGDFLELFGHDAEIAAKVLRLTLTKRQERPMCGIPAHAVTKYARELIDAGHNVAICEEIKYAGPLPLPAGLGDLLVSAEATPPKATT